MLAGLVVAVSAALPAVAATTTEGGYEVTRSQQVTNTTAGWVGRKTTDREDKVGRSPETAGKSSDLLMTHGGFVRDCPTVDGVVRGDFEFLMVANITRTENGEAARATKRLQGNCDGGCDEEVTVLTLKEIDPARTGGH